MERVKTKIQAERVVGRKLRPHLAEYLRAVQRTDRLIYNLVATLHGKPTNDRAPVAAAIFLARVSNDLRACALLARYGYVLQSWTVGSSSLESSYSIGFIGRDEARARSWFKHSDIKTAPWPAFDALAATLKTFELSSHQEAFFGNYRRLSAAKHANPLIQQRYGVLARPDATRINIDPHYSPGIARTARLGLVWTLHGAGLGMWSFAHHFAVNESLQRKVMDFAELTRALLTKVRDLATEPPAT